MNSIGCLIQYGEVIYSLRQSAMIALNTSDWTETDLGTMPEFLEYPGKCAELEIDGRPGNN